jgi:periplasmic protein TonB
MNLGSNTLEEDNSHRLPSFLIALLLYAAFIGLLFLWKIEFKVPEQPQGIEVNFGTDLLGSGDIQTYNKASASKNNYDVKAPGKEIDVAKKAVEKPVEAKPTPTPPAPKVKAVEEKILTTKSDESKITAKEKTEPVKMPKKVVTTPTPVPAKVPANTPVVSKPATPAPVVDNGSVMGKGRGAGGGVNGTVGTRPGEGGNSNGTGAPGTVGDQGDPRGKIDGGSMMGKPGTGGGSAQAISGFQGWRKGKLNLPKDNTDETGKIVFQVKVDDQGEVISISVLERTVSPSVVDFYKRQVQSQMTRILNPDGNPPSVSTGTITIYLNN